jgi:hypothetical protein
MPALIDSWNHVTGAFHQGQTNPEAGSSTSKVTLRTSWDEHALGFLNTRSEVLVRLKRTSPDVWPRSVGQ